MEYKFVKKSILACCVGLMFVGCVASNPTVSTKLKSVNSEFVNALYTKVYDGSTGSGGLVSVTEEVQLISLEKEFVSPITYVKYPAGQYIVLSQKTMDKDFKNLQIYNNKIKVNIDGKDQSVYCGKNYQYKVHVVNNHYYRYSETTCEVDKQLIKDMMEAKSALSVSVSYSDGSKRELPLNLQVLPDFQQHMMFQIKGAY